MKPKSTRGQKIKTTVVYRCPKVINRLRENQTGLQTKTKENTTTMRGTQRNNWNTAVQQNHVTSDNIHRNELFDNYHIPDLVQDILR